MNDTLPDLSGDIIPETPVVRRRDVRPRSSLTAGMVVGSYRILRVLGEGAVGRVFLAEHMILGRKVALKMLRSELSNQPKLVRRFFGEAKAVNDVSHENIVTITDFVEGGEHPAYFIMELLEGQTLEQHLGKHGKLSPEVAASLGAQLASALAAVHGAGFVHRDLKPANVFLIQRGSQLFVKLLDFGVAKLVAAGQSAGDDCTAVGDIVGTPDYMAPEQATALPVDHRADIYALGILLYEMVTNERPFYGDSIEQVLLMQRDELPAPPSQHGPVPAELERLIMRCMLKAPDQRPQSASEVEAALRAFIAARAGYPKIEKRARSAADDVVVRPNVVRRRAPFAAAGLLVLACIVAWYFVVRPILEDRLPPPKSGAVPAVVGGEPSRLADLGSREVREAKAAGEDEVRKTRKKILRKRNRSGLRVHRSTGR